MSSSTVAENVKNVVIGKPLSTAERLHYIYLRNTKKHAEAIQSFATHLAVKSLSSIILEDGEEDRYDLHLFADGSAMALPLFENHARVPMVFTDCPALKKDHA